MIDFTNKIILITGASAGIGRASAILLASLGAKVILNGRNEASLVETKALMLANDHVIAPFDMSDTDGLADWVKVLSKTHGNLDGFVHCAGIQQTRTIRTFDQQFFDETMHTNLASALAITKGFRHKRDKTKQGSIVLVASIAGFVGQPANITYGASKAGLISAARGLALELLRDNIRVNSIAPSLVETQMTQKTREGMSESQFAALVQRHPLGIGQADDVANAVAFLLSDNAKWINAICLPVDGGCLAT